MEPQNEASKDKKAEVAANNEPGETSDSEGESKQSRRQFIKNIGGLILGLTLVDKTARQVVYRP